MEYHPKKNLPIRESMEDFELIKIKLFMKLLIIYIKKTLYFSRKLSQFNILSRVLLNNSDGGKA